MMQVIRVEGIYHKLFYKNSSMLDRSRGTEWNEKEKMINIMHAFF